MARTIGVSLTDEDEARLDRLVGRRGTTNRSKFFREAIEVMERYDRIRILEELQAYGELRSAAAGWAADQMPDLVARIAALDNPDLRAQADELLDRLRYSPLENVSQPAALHPAVRAFLDHLGEPGVSGQVDQGERDV